MIAYHTASGDCERVEQSTQVGKGRSAVPIDHGVELSAPRLFRAAGCSGAAPDTLPR